jgi:4-hydroxy-tetrahydrodipicolinate synthase
MFIEANPVPVKTTLGLMGKLNPTVRLPLVSLMPANLEKLKGILERYQLI